VDIVQLREKSLDDRSLIARAELLRGVCSSAAVPFVLNDRPDLALHVGADGVHVGQDDCPASTARHILGTGALVGLSTHDPHQLRAAQTEPVDYVSAGPVSPTPTKPGRPGTGLGYLGTAASESRLPFFVTGGVTPESVGAMVEAGARHFVVVRYLTQAGDPEGAARSLRLAIDEAVRRAGAPANRAGSPPPAGRGEDGDPPR
jgi:thiamine-phosphate pyrophosphorylase